MDGGTLLTRLTSFSDIEDRTECCLNEGSQSIGRGKLKSSGKGMVKGGAKSPEVFHLANTPSNLYPMAREEKRFLDAMLIGMPRL